MNQFTPTSMHILGINGSLRTGSYNRALLTAAQKLAQAWDQPFLETVAHLQGRVDASGQADIAALKEAYGH